VLFEKIKKGNYDAEDPVWEGISEGAKELVAQLLTVDTSKRLSAEQALAHAWVVSNTSDSSSG
jgi:serine/threonine protein kinase